MPLTQPLFRPWLPPLPDSIALTTIMSHVFQNGHFKGWPDHKNWLEAPIAMLDKYWEQEQPVITSLFKAGRHLQFLGVQDSGRVPALLSTVLALATTHRPEEISFVFFDFGNVLSLFNRLPHDSDYFGAGQFGLIHECLQGLLNLMDERRALYTGRGTGVVANNFEAYRAYQQRQGVLNVEQAQAIFVVIDNYSVWSQGHPDFYYQVLPSLKNLIQNGPTYGIYFILTSDKPSDVASGTLIAYFQTVMLRMDASDLTVMPYNKKLLAVWQNKPGRGFVENTPPYNLIETQCFNPVEGDEVEQLPCLQALLAEISTTYKD